MKYVIDIDEEIFECAKEHRLISHAPVLEAVANGTPLEEVLEDIKAEIENIELNGQIRDVECFNAGVNIAISVIDKHISGKE